MANAAEVAARIIRETENGMQGSRRAQAIRRRIEADKATIADVLELAQENGRILTGSMEKNLPAVLTNEMLYRSEAEIVVRQPMEDSGRRILSTAAEVQQYLNEKADIGIKPIIPELNDDQIAGIITGICNADSFEEGENELFQQIGNFLEGTVDDFTRENADFQYQAGLSPRIERRAVGKCCEWCSRLAGLYDYAEVRDRGNDVFRRHKNCHCIVSYHPGDGSKKRQNDHTKRWTDADRDDRIAFAKSGSGGGKFGSSADPMAEVFGPGEKSHPKEIETFRREAATAGVPIVERDEESLAYAPGIRQGQPGTLYISKGTSYSGWSHEMQHMRDDRDAGWSGMRIMMDRDERFRREKRAYEIEIRMARNAGRDDIVERLKNNLAAERKHIYDID